MPITSRCIALVLSTLAVWPLHAQEEPVAAQEIRERWTGRTLVGSTSTGASVSMQLQSDGTASLSAGSTRDSGTWRVSEGGYCTTWKTIRAGQERCYTVRRTGQKLTVLNPDGSVSGHFSEIR